MHLSLMSRESGPDVVQHQEGRRMDRVTTQVIPINTIELSVRYDMKDTKSLKLPASYIAEELF